VKVDPDTVFFAARLRSYLGRYPSVGTNLYVLNCEEPRTLFGSLEVLSRHATEVYLGQMDTCKDKLLKLDMPEDRFLSQCLDELGVGHVNGFSLLSDRRCKQVSCTDTSKAALGGFRDDNSWVQCWGKSVLR